MNTVVLICYNTTLEQLDLTRAAVASVLAQDIPVELTIVNNGSGKPTVDWLQSESLPANVQVIHHEHNISPIRASNLVLAELFKSRDHVLTVPNDVILPPNCYSELLKFPFGFVSAGMGWVESNQPPPQQSKFLHNDCHFSVILTRRWAYDAMISTWGFFNDEDYFHYASDCDMKQRWLRMGLLGCQTDLQCWHYGSASWRLATDQERAEILHRADVDREIHFKKWGERL